MSITEVGCMGVKPGLDVMDEKTPEGQVLLGIWKAVTSAPGGPHQVYWGLESENPLYIWAFFDWDSVEDHEKFAKAFGGEAVKDFPTILTHGEFTKHVDFTPAPPPALKAPVTEVMMIYFPSDISAAARDEVNSRVQEWVEKAVKSCPDITSMSYGWGLENDFPVRGGEKGQVGSLLMALVGWTSTDAQIRFQETDIFKDNIHLLTELDGVIGMVMSHVGFKRLARKTE